MTDCRSEKLMYANKLSVGKASDFAVAQSVGNSLMPIRSSVGKQRRPTTGNQLGWRELARGDEKLARSIWPNPRKKFYVLITLAPTAPA